MVRTTLSEQLSSYIQAMHEQGILDYHFDHVKALQNEENPRFVVEVINMFLLDAETAMAKVASYLNSSAVDSVKLACFVHQLKGSSASIGGQRMAFACRELRNACDDGNYERSLQLLERVRYEYHILRETFNNISQMERSIHASESRSHISIINDRGGEK